MTGSIYTQKMRSGKTYLYIKLSYIDPKTCKWTQKGVPTGLEEKGNRKKAKEMIPEIIEKYKYLEKSVDLVDHSLNRDILFCDYLDRWLEQKKGKIRPITFEAYTIQVEAIKRYFKSSKHKLADITPYALDSYFTHELKYGKTNQKTGEKEGLAVRTVRSRQSILSNAFKQAIRESLIERNPVDPITISNLKDSDFEEELLFLSKMEIDNLMNFLHEKYPKLLTIAFVGLFYGLRRSEILGLKWSAIDFEKCTITIDNTIVRLHTVMEGNTTKTKNSKRELALFPNAKLCFETIRKTQEEYKEFFGSTYHDSDYVFTQEDGKLIDPNLLSRYFKKAFAAYGRPELSLHKLRHSCASMVIDNGWTVKQVQHWLGHADVETTLNVYSHYDKYKSNIEAKDLDNISASTMKFFE